MHPSRAAHPFLRALATTSIACGLALAACSADEPAPVVSVLAGHLQAQRPDGSHLQPADLVGTELTVLDHRDRSTRIRIDGVHPDPLAPHGPITLYEVSRLDEEREQWVPFCQPGPDGVALALPLAGRWRDGGQSFVEDPHDFTMTCTAGANGKCARMGYLPGHPTESGESLTPYFEACVRMMRADYCGDGSSYTEAGVPVELLDRAGRQPQWERRELSFEAAWGPGGAVCVRRPRDPSRASLADLIARCPRLAQSSGPDCRENALTTRDDALLVNRSPEPTTPAS